MMPTNWQPTTAIPDELDRLDFEFDRQLEEWLAQAGSLLDLEIVAQKIKTPAGQIDLLGRGQAGQWVVLQIMGNQLRGDVLKLAADNAAYLAGLNPADFKAVVGDISASESRTITPMIVVQSSDIHLERMARKLSIHIVTFELFQDRSTHEKFLRRQNTVWFRQAATEPKSTPLRPDVERLLTLADEKGIGAMFRHVYYAALKHGMYPRTYRWSIMYTPPKMRTRVLLCVWVNRGDGELVVYVASEAFAEFYPIALADVVSILGKDGYYRFTPDTIDGFIAQLDRLFERMG